MNRDKKGERTHIANFQSIKRTSVGIDTKITFLHLYLSPCYAIIKYIAVILESIMDDHGS